MIYGSALKLAGKQNTKKYLIR